MNIASKIKHLPDRPGVYLMKDVQGSIIYIGKAASLKKRVSSHFRKSGQTAKQTVMLSKIKDIDILMTSSEAEALILEAGLIKEYKPKYNVAIKDDKAYPMLKLTVKEHFPRLLICRRKKNDGAIYFGPYTSAGLLRKAMALVRVLFPLRICKVMPKSTCLHYHLQQCLGPCAGKIDAAGYKKIVDNLCLFLKGQKKTLIKIISQQMKEATQREDYEQAANLRDQMSSLSTLGTAPIQPFDRINALEQLKQILRLKRLPSLIEGYDISNIYGSEAVGSLVRFKQAHPVKSEYRRFKIKTVEGIDDYAMLREVIKRRYTGSLTKTLKYPDLILIDGGKAHRQVVAEQLRRLHIHIPVISIAKQFEYIYVEWKSEPLVLSQRCLALMLLIRVRDQAHRFAISYHRSLRKKRTLSSELDQIPGVGRKRKQFLLRSINNISNLKQFTLDKLKKIKGIDEKTAKNIVEHWKKY